MSQSSPSASRVIAMAPMPPERSAYALARYSRSPESILQSVDWVRSHSSTKFLDQYYFQYGHASIADLGHLALCFEGISELAATEIEDEPLWDGQAKSSRYQDFSQKELVTPPEFTPAEAASYQTAGKAMIDAYLALHRLAAAQLKDHLPRPEEMKEKAYQDAITARAFDVARYLLPFGVPTNVGQVTSIRTLEKQIRRLLASEYGELRALGEETRAACASPPACLWNGEAEEIAPTLAKYLAPDEHARQSRADLAEWAAQNLRLADAATPNVDLLRPADPEVDVVATLLYPVAAAAYRALHEEVSGWGAARRREVIEVALRSRGRHDSDLLRAFRGGPYVFDIKMDIGAYRDLHRHRRCHQFRQAYGTHLGYETPPGGVTAGFHEAMQVAFAAFEQLPKPAAEYILPFATRGRFLFKMDFAQAEYISRLRSGVKGHLSYRRIAWEMRERMREMEPLLGAWMEATPPWEEDPLVR